MHCLRLSQDCCGRTTGLIRQGSSVECAFRPHAQHARQGLELPLTACRARLPHLDEEIEHMQWQLDKRAHAEQEQQRRRKSRSRISKSGNRSYQQKVAKQHVFRDKVDSSRHHASLVDHRHQKNTDLEMDGSAAALPQGPASEGTLDHRLAAQQQTTEEEAATLASLCSAAVASHHYQQQQQLHCHQQFQQSGQLLQVEQPPLQPYYHLQLQTSTVIPKARDRMFRHIQQDGGCFITSGAADSSMLSHLLLLLQQQQQQQHDSPSILVMQPVDCVEPPSSGPQGYNSTMTATAASHGGSSSTVVQIGHLGRQHSGVCIKLWVTAVPLTAMLGLQAKPSEAICGDTAPSAPAGAVDGKEGSSSSGFRGGSSLGSSSSIVDGTWSFSMESSSEEMAASSPLGTVVTASTSSSSGGSSRPFTNCNLSSNSGGRHISRGQGSADAALITAASSSCSSAAALIQYSVSAGCLKHIRVGTHAAADAVAANLVEAVAAGQLVSLHVKGHTTAHRVAYTAVAAAAARLTSDVSSKAIGVVLVPGALHEHVHAVTHGHAASEGSAASGHAGNHAARIAGDASMTVGGFGAAFYGVRSESRGGGEHGDLQHTHAQEIWLCVVPFGRA